MIKKCDHARNGRNSHIFSLTYCDFFIIIYVKKKKSCLSYAKFPLGRLDEIAQI